MAKVLAYEFELNGVREEITNLDQLNAALKESQRILKSETFGTEGYRQAATQVAALKNAQGQLTQQVKDTGRTLEVTADAGKRSYRALNAELVNARRAFKELSEADRQGKIGQNLLKNIQKIDSELKSIDASIGQYQRNVGNYSSAFASLGGIDIDAFSSIPGAIVAIGGAAITAGKYLLELTNQFDDLRGELSKLVDPAELDEVTALITGISETFGKTTDEVKESANTLSAQFGIPFTDALNLIKNGLLAGGDSTGKFIESLERLGPVAQKTGASAEQFVSSLTKAGIEGLSTKKGLNEAALAASEYNGSITDLVDNTNEYVQEQQKFLDANTRFAAVQVEISKELDGTADGLETIGTKVKTVLLELLLNAIRNVKSFWESLTPVRNALQRVYEALGLVNENGERTEKAVKILNTVLAANKLAWNFIAGAIGFVIDRVADFIGGVTAALEWLGVLDKDSKKTAEAAKAQIKTQKEQQSETKKTAKEIDALSDSTDKLNKRTKQAAVVADQFAKGSIAQLRKEVADLNKELESSDPAKIAGVTARLVQAEQKLAEVEALRNKLRRDATSPVPGVVAPLDGGPTPGDALGPVRSQLDEELNLRTEFERTVTEMRAEELQRRLEDEKRAAEERAAIVAETEYLLFQGTQQVLEALTGLSQARIQTEVAELEERYGREIELAGANEQKKEELRGKLSAEVAKIEKREFERQKRYRIAAAFTSLAEGIVNTLSAPSTIPDPFGTIFKALRVGILIATTAAQVANIQGQQAAKGLLVRAAKGQIIDGRIRGETHQGPSGGVALSLNGMPVIAEHGEALDEDEFGGVAVINKRSTAAFSRTLHSIRGKVFPGKRAILSAINTARGGIPFAATGASVGPSAASVTKTYTATRVVTRLSADDILTMAQVVGEYVRSGSSSGVAEGVERGTIQSFRERRLQNRTGV